MTPEEIRKWIFDHQVYQICVDDYDDCCYPDCSCDKESRPYAKITIQQYIKEIRDEFQKMIEEGYFKLVPYYIPTEKAVKEKEENEKNKESL